MKAYILIFLIISLFLSFSSAERCGRDYNGALCSNNACCSHWGWCGNGVAYCKVPGCQSQCPPLDPNAQCGWQKNGALCPNNLCCSKFGYCGNTEAYCKVISGCQSQCFPGETLPLLSPAPPGSPPPDPNAQCGWQKNGTLCPNNLCCSEYGYCGSTEAYCKVPGCQSQCGDTPPPSPTPPSPTPPSPTPPGPPTGDLSDIISRSQFEEMLKHRNDAACPARGFYTYDAFLTAAKSFPGFGTTGDTATRKKEIAAFFGQTSHETTGGWPTAPDGPYAWGYCFKEEVNPGSDYCSPSATWPCAPGKRYFGRGPMQLSWNYNYGQCGEAIGVDLLNNPEFVSNDTVISFKTAIWFWMTPQAPKPSCHDVMIGQWKPSESDLTAGRLPGYGVTTNIINGGLECGIGQDGRVENRIGFYNRYCNDDIFGVNPGDNLDCYNQRPFGSGYYFLDAAI